ncbi:2-keto-4-pentenoate hydratase [Aquabacterium sp.]|uniref:2-keto-4-pentenoate hydratase n=1 Tax=Aquabacterium sp. TaxID=1872578 RepID=UPI002B961B09|nr:fumarylacetoacetate hydrolase family protein [Aquabacterium sp.]HSW07464.1 fumarylacetoacetate hydrolase family protein [Aquabacterium sp.]
MSTDHLTEAADGPAGVPASADALAAEALAAVAQRRQIAPFSARYAGVDLALAYRAAASIRATRMARGETPVGRKIGFTNRTIWAEYDVWAPIWGDVYDSTVHDIPATGGSFSLAGLAEPRIEPEIVFGLARAPAVDMDDAALLGCIDWVAHGFEIVQSIFPGWKFAAPDTVAAFGLHGALLIGPRHSAAAGAAAWLASLASFEIDLCCDGVVVDRGHAANVLGGPLSALRHLLQGLAQDGAQAPLAAGDIVTTGTVTRAMPVAAGQVWQTVLRGLALPGLELRLNSGVLSA